MRHLGRVNLIGGIGRDKTLRLCYAEGMVKGGVDAVDGRAGQPSALTGTGVDPAAALQLFIELP